MDTPPILVLTGPSNSGKTTLLARLLPALRAAGLRAATLKHAGHLDLPEGRDDGRLAAATDAPVLAASGDALLARNLPAEISPAAVAGLLGGRVDLLLLEGYRRSPYPKIFLLGPGDDRPEPANVCLRLGEGCPLGRDDINGIAQWILDWHRDRQAARADLLAAVLNGGASRRMGTDKASLQIGGRSMLARTVELLGDLVGECWVIGRRPACDDLSPQTQWHMDLAGSAGPMAGLMTGLKLAATRSHTTGLLAVACDMPALGSELLHTLLAARDRTAEATAIFNPLRGTLEPLAAIYEPAAAKSMARHLAGGLVSPLDWLKVARVQAVEVGPELAEQLTNVNTRAELQALLDRTSTPEQ